MNLLINEQSNEWKNGRKKGWKEEWKNGLMNIRSDQMNQRWFLKESYKSLIRLEEKKEWKEKRVEEKKSESKKERE